jgi:nicotinamidase-related amidase
VDLEQLLADSQEFLGWLVDWYTDLPELTLEEVIEAAGGDPAALALFAVDLTVGFAKQGPLSSDRVADIVPAAVRLFERAESLGIRHFLLPQDTHSPDAVEFASYPAHCVAGTTEPQTVPELLALPFSDRFIVIEKDSISSNLNTELEAWLDERPEVKTFIVVGDCTDLCVYQLAMYLRLRANARNLEGVHVIVPSNAVDTFHMPVAVAEEVGAMPHHGDLLHLIFLYSMAQNGIQIVEVLR